ncbi:MAG: hypothetical protein Q6J68_03055 [Thermostichales cyanobacterium SZTDM-1c_bins_54]
MATEKALATLKVLLGAAWADGSLQPEELPILKRAVQQLGLKDYPQLRQLIQTPMSGEDYRQAFREYLAFYPSQEERQTLLELVSELIYVDDQISPEESTILEQLRQSLQDLEPEDDNLNLSQFQNLFSRLLERFHPHSA